MPMPLKKPKPVAGVKQYTATPGETKSVDLNARTVTHYISTPTPDEQNEVLLPRGADISRFTKAPTVFDVHCYGTENVIGRCLKYTIQDDGHVGVTRFADRPPTLPAGVEWRPDTLLHLYNTGDIKGWSIGFNPQEWREPTAKDLTMYGPGIQLVHTRYRVLEYSSAPLPCNEDAITLSLVKRGILSKRLADSLNAGKFPKFDDVAPKKTIVVMNPAPQQKPLQKVLVIIPKSPAPAPAAPSVNPDRVVKHAVAILRGQLYV